MKLSINKDTTIVSSINHLLSQNNNQCPEGMRKNIVRTCICDSALNAPVGTFCDCGKYYKEEE